MALVNLLRADWYKDDIFRIYESIMKILWPSYIHNWISYSGTMTSLY